MEEGLNPGGDDSDSRRREPLVSLCRELLEYGHRELNVEKRPDGRAGVVKVTASRARKTVEAILRLVPLGYDVPIAVLNRTLYEDVLIVHWVRELASDDDLERLNRHDRYVRHRLLNGLERYGLMDADQRAERLPGEEWTALKEEFGGRDFHWTGMSTHELAELVAKRWTPSERHELAYHREVVNVLNNQLTHNSSLALRAQLDEGSWLSVELAATCWFYLQIIDAALDDDAEREDLANWAAERMIVLPGFTPVEGGDEP